MRNSRGPKVKRRSNTFVFILIIGAMVAGGLCYGGERDPVYRGHKLSEWLMGDSDLVETSDAELVTAEDAITHSGTNGVPVLLRLLKRKDFAGKQRMNELFDRIGVQHEFRLAEDYHEAALRGFRILGPAAEGAIPQLARLLLQEATAYPAAEALQWIGLPSIVPPLTRALTNRSSVIAEAAAEALLDFKRSNPLNAQAVPHLARALFFGSAAVQSAAEELLKSLTPEAEPHAVVALAPGLTNSDPNVRRSVASIFGMFESQQDRVLPILTVALGDSDAAARYAALHSLAWLGGDPQIAIPVWRGFLNDSDRSRRASATNMLVHLNDKEFAELRRKIAIARGVANRPVLTATTISNLTFNLTNADPIVRRIAATQLGRHGARAETAIAALQQLERDRDEDVRLAGSNAVRQIAADLELMKGAAETASPDESERQP
jgi:HEAT repeat protein